MKTIIENWFVIADWLKVNPDILFPDPGAYTYYF